MIKFKTTATTQNNSYDVVITAIREVSPIQGIAYWDHKATITIDGNEFDAEIRTTQEDRIYATKQMCDALSIPYERNMAIRCDISEAYIYTRNQDRIGYAIISELEQSEERFLSTHNL